MVWMITATLISPQGDYHTPAFQSLKFDSKEDCMYYLNNENNGEILIQSLSRYYPGHVFVNIGCGQWDFPPKKSTSA